MKAMRFPSGEKRASSSVSGPRVSRRRAPSAVSQEKRSEARFRSSLSPPVDMVSAAGRAAWAASSSGSESVSVSAAARTSAS